MESVKGDLEALVVAFNSCADKVCKVHIGDKTAAFVDV